MKYEIRFSLNPYDERLTGFQGKSNMENFVIPYLEPNVIIVVILLYIQTKSNLQLQFPYHFLRILHLISPSSFFIPLFFYNFLFYFGSHVGINVCYYIYTGFFNMTFFFLYLPHTCCRLQLESFI